MATVTRMRVLLIGASGQLGQSVLAVLPAAWVVCAPSSVQCDITQAAVVWQQVHSFQPDIIINCAAFTQVDLAQSQPERALEVNLHGARHLAQAAHACGARLLQISTDYVFDGHTAPGGSYVETDLPSPVNRYGQSKWLAEQAVLALSPQALVVRTGWLFSEYGHNFVRTMLGLYRAQLAEVTPKSALRPLGVVADQVGCPTYTGDLARVLLQLVQQQAEPGVYHYAGESAVSWFGFAKQIFEQADRYQWPPMRKLDLHAAQSQAAPAGACQLIPLTSAQYAQQHTDRVIAPRPAYSALNCDKIKRYGGVPSPWPQRLAQVVAALNSVSVAGDTAAALPR